MFPATRSQRCWFPNKANVLAALPKSARRGALAAMKKIYNAEDIDKAVAKIADDTEPQDLTISHRKISSKQLYGSQTTTTSARQRVLGPGGAALLIALLGTHSQQLFYIPGRIVHRAAATYRGDGKIDAKDARIIADQTRMRTNLHVRPRSGPDQCRPTTDCSQPAAPSGTARSATVFGRRSRRPSRQENAPVIGRPASWSGLVVAVLARFALPKPT